MSVNTRTRNGSPKYGNGVALAMHGCRGNREDFIRLLNRQGIDVVFRENNEGRIYGVTFIDHKNSEVYNGSRLGKEFSANAFERLFNRPQEFPEPESTGHILTGKAVSLPTWKAPSSRLSEYSSLTSTVPTRRKRLSHAGYNARKKKKRRSRGIS